MGGSCRRFAAAPKAVCLIAVLGSVAPAASQDGVRRPIQDLMQSEVVYPQEKHELQVSLGSRLSRRSASPDLELFTSLEYGITDSWQVGLRWTNYPREGSPSVGSVGVKRSFMNLRGSRTHLAVGFEADIPRRSRDERTESGEYEPFIVVAHDMPGGKGHLFAAFAANLGGKRDFQFVPQESATGKTLWNVGGFLTVGHLALTSELTWAADRWNCVRASHQVAWTPGIVIRMPGDQVWEFAIGVPVGITRSADRVGIILRITHEFEGIGLPRRQRGTRAKL